MKRRSRCGVFVCGRGGAYKSTDLARYKHNESLRNVMSRFAALRVLGYNELHLKGIYIRT